MFYGTNLGCGILANVGMLYKNLSTRLRLVLQDRLPHRFKNHKRHLVVLHDITGILLVVIHWTVFFRY